MLEAVNSVISNASLVRGQAEQQSSARSLATNPDSVQIVPQAPFISPYVHLDINYDKAVLQIRDSETGDVVRQIPSEPALEASRRQLSAQARTEQLTRRLEPDQARAARRQATTPQAQPQPQPQPEQKIVAQTPDRAPRENAPAPQAGAFDAFAKQVASLQSAIAGHGTGATVSLSA